MEKRTQSSLLANCCLPWLHALYNNKIMQRLFFYFPCFFLHTKTTKTFTSHKKMLYEILASSGTEIQTSLAFF